MPNRNGFGPSGQGPRTGWGNGYCGSRTGRFGRAGRGFRHGRMHGYPEIRILTPEEEQAELKTRAEELREELAFVEKRLNESGNPS